MPFFCASCMPSKASPQNNFVLALLVEVGIPLVLRDQRVIVPRIIVIILVRSGRTLVGLLCCLLWSIVLLVLGEQFKLLPLRIIHHPRWLVHGLLLLHRGGWTSRCLLQKHALVTHNRRTRITRTCDWCCRCPRSRT